MNLDDIFDSMLSTARIMTQENIDDMIYDRYVNYPPHKNIPQSEINSIEILKTKVGQRYISYIYCDKIITSWSDEIKAAKANISHDHKFVNNGIGLPRFIRNT